MKVRLGRAGRIPVRIVINSELCESPRERKLQHLSLLTKLGTMKTSLRRLSPKEFDAALLKKLTSEGRVYIDIPSKIKKDTYTREILDYVQSIKDYAADEWHAKIDDLWQKLVNCDALADYLTMKRGLQTGHMNRYAITLLVCRMQSMGLYRKDVSMQTLHLKMEGAARKNKYYTSCGNYVLPKEVKALLRDFFKSIK